MTADDILKHQGPFLRAVGRRAAQRVAAQVNAGGRLHQIAEAALDRRDFQQRARDAATDATTRERCAIEIADGEMDAICALRAAHATAGMPIADDALIALMIRMTQDAGWRLVDAGYSALTIVAVAGGRLPAAALVRAGALATTAGTPTWSQVAALRFLAKASGPDAAPILEQRLVPRPDADDLFVRAEATRLLGDIDAETAARAIEAHGADPSEHVRLEQCAVMGRLGLRAPLVRRLDPKVEHSPRVRAAAAIAVAAQEPDALAWVLLRDPDPLPRRAALEEAESHLDDNAAVRNAVEQLVTGGPWPILRRLAADALERSHHRTDAEAARTLNLIRARVEGIPDGQTGPLLADLTDLCDLADFADLADLADQHLGRAMATLTQHDHGLTLERIGRDRWRLLRGDRPHRRLWRVLHELGTPSGEKRQGHLHTIGRTVRGHLRAASGIMAEASPTGVPGQRVLVTAAGDWGRHLPAVDDLLSRPAAGQALIFSSFGVTTVDYPSRARWPLALLRLHRDFASLANLRQRSLAASEAKDRRAYSDAVAALGWQVRFSPYRGEGPPDIVQVFGGAGSSAAGAAAASAAPPAGAALAIFPFFEVITAALQQPRPAAHLLAAGAAALGLMLARLSEARRQIEDARRQIPLCIGGWGTRGKSGTERLKTALFQALGCRVLTKTTGCEAVVLHAIPGVRSEEIFLYRPYDKATIWEQRDVVTLAAKLKVDVLLWECMALNPTYVDILQGWWMRDDLGTLTNAYPDHENIQGPSGIDVAHALSQFIPRGRTLLTAEEQMLPILRDAATARGTQMIAVSWRDHALLPADLLARFPYDEHPHNIALVIKMAETLGITRAVAIKEMADGVVPDLGVLKTYPTARWRGRRLRFSNGMSANERTGFMSNWSRLGLDHLGDPDGEWVVTVINNRADRVSRSGVFAEILVRDVAAHRHVLIGTNLRGLQKFIRDALAAFTRELVLFDAAEADLGAPARGRLALARAAAALARIKLETVGWDRLAHEVHVVALANSIAAVGTEPAVFADAFRDGGLSMDAVRAAANPRLASALGDFVTSLGPWGEAAFQHLLDLGARHSVILAWQDRVRVAATADAHRGEQDERRNDAREDTFRTLQREFRAIYAQLFLSTLLVLDDPGATGDRIVDHIAGAAPPGFLVRLIGGQNIKGTGLDFAYRWLAFDETTRFAAQFAAATDADKPALAEAFVARTDVGVLDLDLAYALVGDAAAQAPASDRLAVLANTISGRLAAASGALQKAGHRTSAGWRRNLNRLTDVFDGIVRRRRADRIMNGLGSLHLSQSEAAQRMRRLSSSTGGTAGRRA